MKGKLHEKGAKYPVSLPNYEIFAVGEAFQRGFLTFFLLVLRSILSSDEKNNLNLFFLNFMATEFSFISHFSNTIFVLSGQLLLPPVHFEDLHKICLIIDLDETLVHSSFKVSFLLSLCIIKNLK